MRKTYGGKEKNDDDDEIKANLVTTSRNDAQNGKEQWSAQSPHVVESRNTSKVNVDTVLFPFHPRLPLSHIGNSIMMTIIGVGIGTLQNCGKEDIGRKEENRPAIIKGDIMYPNITSKKIMLRMRNSYEGEEGVGLSRTVNEQDKQPQYVHINMVYKLCLYFTTTHSYRMHNTKSDCTDSSLQEIARRMKILMVATEVRSTMTDIYKEKIMSQESFNHIEAVRKAFTTTVDYPHCSSLPVKFNVVFVLTNSQVLRLIASHSDAKDGSLVKIYRNTFLDGDTEKIIESKSELHCLGFCLNSEAFVCKSITFFPETHGCFLNSISSSTSKLIGNDEADFRVVYIERLQLKSVKKCSSSFHKIPWNQLILRGEAVLMNVSGGYENVFENLCNKPMERCSATNAMCVADVNCNYAYMHNGRCSTSSELRKKLPKVIERHCHDSDEANIGILFHEASKCLKNSNGMTIEATKLKECMQLCHTHPTKSCDAINFYANGRCELLNGLIETETINDRIPMKCRHFKLNVIAFSVNERMRSIDSKIRIPQKLRKSKRLRLQFPRKNNQQKIWTKPLFIDREADIKLNTVCHYDSIIVKDDLIYRNVIVVKLNAFVDKSREHFRNTKYAEIKPYGNIPYTAMKMGLRSKNKRQVMENNNFDLLQFSFLRYLTNHQTHDVLELVQSRSFSADVQSNT
ncbi:PAN domain protein [Dictyocaulus viviparus]|uniref:PAN domain protein n=1 Tax=Dictyocaulus viviparus TaxID=29172 RepID=A0A0D8Y821_DICVI|nr:PAN domain protein [Dictyocaulus viviparus]